MKVKKAQPGENPSCFLCGLEAGYLPSISGQALVGISCACCGNYYLDDFLATLGVTDEDADLSLISGFTKRETAFGKPAPIINMDKVAEIIRDNRNYSETEKVDKLLVYYSHKEPRKNADIEFVANLDYPITFSPDSDEFVYLLETIASQTLDYTEIRMMTSPPEGYFRIRPKGWARIEELKKGTSPSVRHGVEPEIDTAELLKREEDKNLEFKATFDWDIRQQKVNKELRKEVIITLAAFNNTEGGYLLIGVNDDGTVFGLEKDFESITKPNKLDIFRQKMSMIIAGAISSRFASSLVIHFQKVQEKTVCKIRAPFGDGPVYVKEDNDEKAFYIRVQNYEKKLSAGEAHDYIVSTWKKR